MKAGHSHSLILIWRLAEHEAQQLGAQNIEPTHLLLGLCKAVDVDLRAIVPTGAIDFDLVLEELLREVRRLRNVFQITSLDVRTFRRALRSRIGGGRLCPSELQFLHRSECSKQIFDQAGKFAEMSDSLVYPVQLLYALVSIQDEQRDSLLKEMGVDLTNLVKAAKHAITPSLLSGKHSIGLN